MENNFDVENFLQKKEDVSNHLDNEKSKFDQLQDLLSRESRVYSEVVKNINGKTDGQTIFLCDPVNATDLFVAISKRLIEKEMTPVIVLTTVNYKAAKKVLKEANIEDKVILIDTVSKGISNVVDQEKVLFVDSLRNLTQLQIKIVKIIQANENISFVFDALNVLELYHSQTIIMKFTYSISKLLKKNKLNAYYSITKASFAPKLSQFFDNLVEIRKIE